MTTSTDDRRPVAPVPTIRAALYLRVSTEEQSASLAAQESGARAWCEAHAATVVEVYSDEGTSGAQWDRPGLQRMLDDVRTTPRPWDVLVVRDLDRISRDALRLGLAVERLQGYGARCIAWSTGEEIQPDPMARALLLLRGVLAEQERAMIAHRTRTALRQRAEAGFVTGGSVFGYATERDDAGARYVVDPVEAPVVVEIYERHAAGESARKIAKDLNVRGVPSPRSDGGGTGSWCGESVLTILRSTRYRGEATWGRIGSRYREGARITERRTDVVRYEVPAIVTPDLWQRAQERSLARRTEAQYRPAKGPSARYLLIGHAVCDTCGGPIASWRTTSGSGPIAQRRVVRSYRCGWHARRGDAICRESYCRPLDPIDRAVLDSLAAALSPDQVTAALARAREQQRRGETPDRRAELLEAERHAAARVTRLGAALEHGAGDVTEVLTRLRAAESDLARARTELRAAVAAAPVLDFDMERELVRAAADVRGTIAAGYELAAADDERAMAYLRRLLGAALPSPLRVRGVDGGVELTGAWAPGALLVTERPGTCAMAATPTGITHCTGWREAVLIAV